VQPRNQKAPPQASRLRVERPEDPEIAEDDSSSWAVSYSDLLMVLMSFFVMFFQFTPEKTKTIIQQLAVTVGTGGGGAGIGKGAGVATESPAGLGSTAATGVKPTLATLLVDSFKASKLNVSVEKTSDSLSILLPDNIYKPRGFKVSDEMKTVLSEVMERVRPFAADLDIYFIGHADADPLSKGNEYLTDNFSLSALRATHALQFALDAGFPKSHLFAQGGAENLRNSRTLSVKVRPHTSAGE
jgi:flagellar motor protein MotB